MQTNKRIKLISRFDSAKMANASFEGLDGQTTFGQVKQIAQLLVNKGSGNQKYGLYFNNVEMNLNNDNITIDEIFENESDILIEIGPKIQGENTGKISSYEGDEKLLNFSSCDAHKNETARYYCNNCNESICFKCSLDPRHQGHYLQEKIVYYNSKLNNIIERFENIKTSIQTNEIINNYKNIRAKHLAEIDDEFKAITAKVQELRSYYLGFYEEYYKALEKNIANVTKQFGENEKDLVDLKNNFSMKEESFRMNIGKIENLTSTLSSLMRENIKLNDLFGLSRELDFCYKENLNNFYYLIEKVALGGYFSESVISEYDRITFDKSINKELIAAHEEILSTYEQTQNVVLMPVPTSNKVLAYNFTKKQFILNEIPADKHTGEQFSFFDFARYFNLGNYIIVTGGVSHTDQASKEVSASYLYDFANNEVHQLENMKSARSVHMLFHLPPKLILAISGKETKEVEVYSLQKRVWAKFKSLSKPRCNANALNYENKYLYVFGGSDTKSYTGQNFERIQISDLFNDSLVDTYFQNNFSTYKGNFESGSFIIEEAVNILFTGFGLIELEDDTSKKFLILGGYNSMFDNDYLLNTDVRTAEYIPSKNNFNVVNNESKLPSSSCFYYQSFNRVDENLLALFNASGELVLYNTQKCDFEVLKHNLLL